MWWIKYHMMKSFVIEWHVSKIPDNVRVNVYFFSMDFKFLFSFVHGDNIISVFVKIKHLASATSI